MIILADNDIIYKLACFDLLQELITFFGCNPQDIHVLSTFKYQLRKNKKFRQNPVVVARCEAFLASVSEAPVAATPNLEKFTGLDTGEQILFAVMIEQYESNRLITGDKRALELVGKLAANDHVLLEQLSGRVECLEGILLGMIDLFGFDAVNAKVTDFDGVDGVCQIAFGKGRTREHAEEALRSWLNGLRGTASFVNTR